MSVSSHFVTLWSFAVVNQKLSHHDEEVKDQPWGEQSSDESSTEEDEVRMICGSTENQSKRRKQKISFSRTLRNTQHQIKVVLNYQ